MENNENRQKKAIIYFSLVEWDFLWSRPQQMISRLSHDRKILYVEVHGVRNIVSDFHFPDDLFRIIKKLGSWFHSLLKGPRQINENLCVINPIIVPLPGNKVVRKFNQLLLRRSLRKLIRTFLRNSPILLFTIAKPDLLALIGTLDEAMIAYDCMDDYADFPSTHEDFLNWEAELLEKADVVSVSSQALFDKKNRPGPNFHLIPNGVQFEHFHKAVTEDLNEPEDIQQIPHPRCLYFGVINDWFDKEIVFTVASQRPEFQFILIGIDVINMREANTLTNIHFFDRKDYNELPAYLRYSDVAIIPFRITPLTIATSPIKLFEYLAAGVPVISTPLPEVVQYREIVSIASNAEEFEKAIDRYIEKGAKEQIDRQSRIDFARQHSWDERCKQLDRAFQGVEKRAETFHPQND